MIENVSSKLHAHIKKSPLQAVNFRKVFEFELFGVALKEVSFSTFWLTFVIHLIGKSETQEY